MSHKFDTFKQIETLESETYQQQRSELLTELAGYTRWESVYNFRLRTNEKTHQTMVIIYVAGDLSRYREYPYTPTGIQEAIDYVAPNRRIPDELVDNQEYNAWLDYVDTSKADEY